MLVNCLLSSGLKWNARNPVTILAINIGVRSSIHPPQWIYWSRSVLCRCLSIFNRFAYLTNYYFFIRHTYRIQSRIEILLTNQPPSPCRHHHYQSRRVCVSINEYKCLGDWLVTPPVRYYYRSLLATRRFVRQPPRNSRPWERKGDTSSEANEWMTVFKFEYHFSSICMYTH